MRAYRVGLPGLCAVGVVSALLATAVPASATAEESAQGNSPAPVAVSGKGVPGGSAKLTSRLQRLAIPAVANLPSAARARALSLAQSGPGSIMLTAGGDLVVEVTVADTSGSTLAALSRAGAEVEHVSTTMPVVTVAVATGELGSLAAVPQVLHVAEVLTPIREAACPSGIVSEGVAQMRVDASRSAFPGITGSDIEVGILSDSYDALGGAATDVVNAELPGAANPCGHTGSVAVLDEDAQADEGRAMAQIVHDVAPGASLAFATAYGGEQVFADNIRALASAGASVIVDDISYLAEPMYQDGVVGKAVEDVSAAGVAFFSSAANSNTIVGGNDVASYEAPSFRPAPCPPALAGNGNPCHDFDPGPGEDTTHGITLSAAGRFVLGWNEPQYGVTTDLDFFLLDASGMIVASSAEFNRPTDPSTTNKPHELIYGGGAGDYDLVVQRFAGTDTPRLKWVSYRAPITANEYPVSSGGDVVGPTTYGHHVSRSGAAVAAVEFSSPSALEPFSSRGPAMFCWGPVTGTSPAAPLPGGCQGATVDVAATDGGANSFFGRLVAGVRRFYGTSAAAPHAAAVAALVRQARPCLTPDRVISLLRQTARPVGSFGIDAVGGGLVDANAALAAAGSGPCGGPAISLSLPPVPATGWYPTAVSGTVTATDADRVADLTCVGAAVTGVTGRGTTTANATVTFSAAGVTSLTCNARDSWGDVAAPSTTLVRVGARPVVIMRSPTTVVSLASSSVVRWAASMPRGAPPATIASYLVQRAIKLPGRKLGPYVNLGGPRTGTALTQSMKPGIGYCFRVAATPSVGPTSGWSAPRCVTMPGDDRSLVVPRTGGWIRARSTAAYLRTVTASTRVGATLVLPVSRGSRLALVVTTQPGGGTIGVYVRNRRVATVSTGARRVTPKVVVMLRVATIGTPVVLRVDARGSRGVAIDGLAQLP